ncbi:MAG: hypothetical protein ACRD26_06355 [Vicinamibacterales bacterium]
MGLEAEVTAQYGGQTDSGKAKLESQELVFKGERIRVKLPVTPSTRARVEGGKLIVRTGREELTLELGKTLAEKWATKITHPKSRMEKLDVRPGAVVLLKMRDPSLTADLEAAGAKVARSARQQSADLVFWRVHAERELSALGELAPLIKPTGALWVVYPKGADEITQGDVMAAAKRTGLVYTKIVAFSDAESALKLMIPRDKR